VADAERGAFPPTLVSRTTIGRSREKRIIRLTLYAHRRPRYYRRNCGGCLGAILSHSTPECGPRA